ncbi:hypothetical protein EC973_003961 [Apophysomyces ossiformis]|uniref:SAC domain-containing protein n=1 Tax=Apophysomyces ossiformis TaxID=679940 RepID=A0A8H7EQ75_9FUNG|nr:hypothetical protein EC973_003961 [Apophysomyces ossiformis]
MIFEQLQLRITDSVYVFTPIYEPAKEGMRPGMPESLTVDRNSGVLQLNGNSDIKFDGGDLMLGLCSAPPAQTKVLKELVVYGIMGFIKLQAEYMIIITGRQRIGALCGSDVFRATSFQILPVPSNLDMLSGHVEEEQIYIHLLEDHLKQNSFYFSYGYDLTLSVQQRASRRSSPNASWRKADERFFWNRFLSEKLIHSTTPEQDMSSFILPMIQGFVAITTARINKRTVMFGLISRRSKERAGTRYFSRGLDSDGHASNFVETEQILFFDKENTTMAKETQLSFVQTRGSVPGIWGQIPNTRYTPQLWTDHHGLDPSHVHFREQIRIYGPQILINLVNKKGYEQPVGELYARIVEALADPRLFYVHFDFHHECRKMKWHRVQLLLDQLEPELRKEGYCHYDETDSSMPQIHRTQDSVVRTNCMDCLDRTNVVQSSLARWVLNRQLRDVSILQSTEVIENDEEFMKHFMNVWADNADALSIAYSGTGALKTDYTRTGKRTHLGALNDLMNSLSRYVKNNYLDGSRQDGIRSSTLYVFVLSFCFAVTLSSWHYIQQHGTQFIDWPRLKPVMPHHPVVRWSQHRRSDSTILDEAEQGYELPTLKKIT